MRSEMKRQSTSIGCSSITLTTQRDVIHAQGHTGSQKNSRSAMPRFYPLPLLQAPPQEIHQRDDRELPDALTVAGEPEEGGIDDVTHRHAQPDRSGRLPFLL